MRHACLAVVGSLVIAVLATGTAAGRPLMTKSQARAIVRDVNLAASDMPGYDSMPSDPPSSRDRQDDVRLTRCAGSVPVSRALATGSSPVFIRGTSSNFDIFGSIVSVFPKAALVRKDL